jgi:hnRNP-L/PTB/hephaestus splicing factor
MSAENNAHAQQQYNTQSMYPQQQQQQPSSQPVPSYSQQSLGQPSSKPQQQRGHKSSGMSTNGAASKVLHIRGLPPYTSENDLLTFFSQTVGTVPTRILILPNSNQAFIQLNSIEAAHALLQQQAAQGGSFSLKNSNKNIVVQYSTRSEIHTPLPTAGGGGAGGQNQAQAASSSSATAPLQIIQQPSQHHLQHSQQPPLQQHHTGGGAPHDSQQTANSILIITVLNTRVPVTLEHIHSICKPYGDVLKCITFHKNGVFKALVQFGTIESAVNARMLLEGKDIFQGCCHLRIGFSSLHDLHVKTSGNHARDFTSPSGATQSFAEGGSAQGYAQAGAHATAQGYGAQSQGLINPGATGQGGYGGGGYAPQDQGAYHHASAAAAAGQQQQQQFASSPHPQQPGCVVLVSNLPETRVTCDVLFTLFGVYGDVQRVKILYNKRDTALVQYVSPQSAYLAALHLNHLHLYGKQISVTPSKHIEVSLPKTLPNGGTQSDLDQAQSGLTQDYSHSPIHRFKRSQGVAVMMPGVQGGPLGIHAKSIHPPSQVLHVSSLAEAVTEDELRALFSTLSHPSTSAAAASAAGESSSPNAAAGAASGENEEKVAQTPPIVQFFTNAPKQPINNAGGGGVGALKPSKQAFLKFDSVSAAVENLIEHHNYQLHGRYLRISFSGKDANQVHETSNGQPLQTPQPQQQQQSPQQGQGGASSAQANGSSPSSKQQQQSSSAASASVTSPSASTSTGAEGQAAQ